MAGDAARAVEQRLTAQDFGISDVAPRRDAEISGVEHEKVEQIVPDLDGGAVVAAVRRPAATTFRGGTVAVGGRKGRCRYSHVPREGRCRLPEDRKSVV